MRHADFSIMPYLLVNIQFGDDLIKDFALILVILLILMKNNDIELVWCAFLLCTALHLNLQRCVLKYGKRI